MTAPAGRGRHGWRGPPVRKAYKQISNVCGRPWAAMLGVAWEMAQIGTWSVNRADVTIEHFSCAPVA